MPSLILPVAILALNLDHAFSSPNSSSSVPSKNHLYHFTESRGELFGSTMEISLRGTKASTSNSHHPVKRQNQAVYSRLLAPTSIPTTSSPASSRSPSSHVTDSYLRITARETMVDDVIGLLEYQPSTQHTISLQVFLLDTLKLMDDESTSTFELTALEFIVEGIDRIDLSIEAISDVTVVDQRLTWSRMVDGKSTTGIEVYFEADATASWETRQTQLERAIQALFDSRANAFRRKFDLALSGEEDIDSPELTTETLEAMPMKMSLGMAATAAGCVGFIVVLVISVFYVNKKETEESKDLSKTSIVVGNNDNTVHGRLSFPVQEATGDQNLGNVSSDSEEEELTFDNGSFNASLVFCPSVEKEPKYVGAAFDCDQSGAAFDCDQSAIANIENLTDSDGDEPYEYSPIRAGAQKDCSPRLQLTDEDLSNFDEEMRRAEC